MNTNISKLSSIHPTAIVYPDVTIKDNVVIGPYTIVYPNTIIKENTNVGPYCIIGEPKLDFYSNRENYVFDTTIIGENCIIRSNNIIYEGSNLGENLSTGHHVTIREETIIGKNCSIGTLSDIQGKVKIGNFVRLHSNVHIGQLTQIKDYAWIFPYVVTTNDMYPPMDKLQGCTIEEYAIVTTGSILLPGVNVGKNSMVAAGSVVSKDVKEESLVMGVPAKEKGSVRDIRDEEGKNVYPWVENLTEFRGYPWQTENQERKI